MAQHNSIFKRKNILVTGGAGFIGSHLCDQLLALDNNVICIDDFISGQERNINHLLKNDTFRFIRHNINEPIDLEAKTELKDFKIKFYGIQEIYHLACPTSPKDFEKMREETILANSVGVKNILEIAKKYKSKFLLASSSVVYGPQPKDKHLIKEEDLGCVDQLSKRSCYDEGKRFAESFVNLIGELYDLDIKIARIFRTYGPRMKLDGGEPLSDFFASAISNQDLVIYGDEGFESSLCYVDDVVDGLIKLMKSKIGIGPVNIGDDSSYFLKDVAQRVIDLVGSKSKIRFDEPHIFITPLPIPDISKAKKFIGWLPVTTLDVGLKKTIDYFMASKDLLGY